MSALQGETRKSGAPSAARIPEPCPDPSGRLMSCGVILPEIRRAGEQQRVSKYYGIAHEEIEHRTGQNGGYIGGKIADLQDSDQPFHHQQISRYGYRARCQVKAAKANQ